MTADYELTYRIDQDERLVLRLDDLEPRVGLFADPNQEGDIVPV
jgi:hypothetical protein